MTAAKGGNIKRMLRGRRNLALVARSHLANVDPRAQPVVLFIDIVSPLPAAGENGACLTLLGTAGCFERLMGFATAEEVCAVHAHLPEIGRAR